MCGNTCKSSCRALPLISLELFVLAAAILPIAALWVAATVTDDPSESLLAAAQSGNTWDVDCALRGGARTGVRDSGSFTPLMIAARAGHAAVVTQLLDSGADIDARTPACGTALMQAALYGHESVVQQLLARGARVDSRTDTGQTALWYAVISGETKCSLIQLLLSAGADPYAPDLQGWTPVMMAASLGKEAWLEHLSRR
jgi:ankyrin repeat protein